MGVRMSTLLTQSQLCRQLDKCPATIARAIDGGIVSPDFSSGRQRLFRAERLDEIRIALDARKAARRP